MDGCCVVVYVRPAAFEVEKYHIHAVIAKTTKTTHRRNKHDSRRVFSDALLYKISTAVKTHDERGSSSLHELGQGHIIVWVRVYRIMHMRASFHKLHLNNCTFISFVGRDMDGSQWKIQSDGMAQHYGALYIGKPWH